MRKRITRTLLAAVALCAALNAEAYDFEAGGIYYNIISETDKTVEVTSGSNNYTGDITIPATVTNSGTVYTVTAIGVSAFEYYSLKSIGIPDGVTEIGSYAFAFCGNLTKVSIGSGVETIGRHAFSVCSSLNRIYCATSVPPVCGNISCFLNVDMSACTLYVPEGTADAYKAAYVWKNFFNIVETDFAGIEDIAADAAADVKVYAAAGRIVVENAGAGTPIAVYSADGVQIYGGAVSDTFTEIPVPAGKLYIVKCGNAVFKTVM